MKKLVFIALLAVSVPAGARVLDRIAAVIDDQVVTLSEVDDRAALLRDQNGKKMEGADVRKQALESLVEEKLFDEQMKELNIEITDSQLEMAIGEVRKENGLDSDEALQKLVERQGMSWRDYRDNMRRQLAQAKLISLKVRSRVKVDEEEVKRRYAELSAADQGEREVHAAHILISVKPGASAAEVEAARKKAEGLMERARKGEDFSKLAATFSDGPSKENGGDLSWFKKGEMVKEIDGVAFTLKPGDVSDPVRSRFGWHVVKVLESRAISPRPLAEMADGIRDALYREGVERETKKYLSELKKAAVIEYKMPELRLDGSTI